jgi:hypothetical protein
MTSPRYIGFAKTFLGWKKLAGGSHFQVWACLEAARLRCGLRNRNRVIDVCVIRV